MSHWDDIKKACTLSHMIYNSSREVRSVLEAESAALHDVFAMAMAITKELQNFFLKLLTRERVTYSEPPFEILCRGYSTDKSTSKAHFVDQCHSYSAEAFIVNICSHQHTM